MNIDTLKAAVRDIPDFPKKGIVFKDICPILSDPKLLQFAVKTLAKRHATSRIDKVAAIESRGFIFGAGVAQALDAGLIPVRKKGKLPYKTIETSYSLEYGEAVLQMHKDALRKGERILILDDLLATGGTAAAAAVLVEKLGGKVVEIEFLIELAFLKGREKLSGYNVFAPVVF